MALTTDGYLEFDSKRLGGNRSSAARKDFEVDKGRIVHSAAFRRLQGKTQVLGVGERDFYRTRLTHSLEVAQLGRGMCVELPSDGFSPDPDLVEAICLAHDIGHPPFGHSGEDFLHAKMKSFGGFGANPQNIRLVTFLEAKFAETGLDLTRACIDGLTKYPDLYDKSFPDLKEKAPHENSKFTYSSQPEEIELFRWIKKDVDHPDWTPIEGQIADLADQMAYSVNDIEDAIRAGLFNPIDMRNRAEEISARAKAKLKKIAARDQSDRDDVPELTDPAAIAEIANKLQIDVMEPRDYRLRKINLKSWTSEQIKNLKGARIVERSKTERSVRYRYGLKIEMEANATIAVLKEAASLLVFADPRVTTLEEKGHHIIDALFDTFCAGDPRNEKYRLMPIDFQQLIEKKIAPKERLVADFISGMTDRYAYSYYSRLFEPGAGSFYEYV
jgi:dGTPase